ncbi:MAG: AAA family ATPase, partial [Pyramidobacter sp.]|nr:AAA family ATPase [Pyramidobacter sp.]
MERTALYRMREWKERPRRKPLLLTGVRQCGKTWLLQEFGRQDFERTLL